MNFLKYFLLNFCIYQFFGLAPFSVPLDNKSRASRKQWKWYIYNSLLILLVIVIIAFNVIEYSKLIGKSIQFLAMLNRC